MTATQKARAPKPDHIYAAIEKHVAAREEMTEVGKQHDRAAAQDLAKKDPAAWKAIDRRWCAAIDREDALSLAVTEAQPMSAEGFAAKAQYLWHRELEAEGGFSRGETEREALYFLSRDAAKVVRPPYSDAYRRLLTILATIRAELKELAARRAAYRKSPKYKREQAEARARATPPKERKLTARELAAQVKLFKVIHDVIGVLDPARKRD